MTEEASKILKTIKDYVDENGTSPSLRDIAKIVNISPKTVLHYLFELESNGVIKRSPYRARNIQLVENGEEQSTGVSHVPLVGMSAGGPAILAQQNIEEYIPVSTKLIGNSKDTFLLKVKGSSMQPYIDNGDIAVVRPQDRAEKGDVIVAVIESATGEYESTIKEYYPTDDVVILKPINPKFDPILVSREKLHIQGIIKGVIKYLN